MTLSFVAKLLMLVIVILVALSHSVSAQYNYQMGGGYGESGGGDAYGGGYDGGTDDRAKVNLGIRLRIPAFKFELPRFSLPKITVSAKIRQPDKPRYIQLPEINVDTSSKSELPKMQGGGGSYGGGGGYGNQYQGPAYGMGSASSYGGEEKTGMISFSTEMEHAPAYGQQYPSVGYTNTHRQQAMNQANNYQQQQRHYQKPSYSASNVVQSSYSMYNKPAGSNQVYQHHVQQQQEAVDKNPDLGFNSPAYAGMQSAKSVAA